MFEQLKTTLAKYSKLKNCKMEKAFEEIILITKNTRTNHAKTQKRSKVCS